MENEKILGNENAEIQTEEQDNGAAEVFAAVGSPEQDAVVNTDCADADAK